VSAAASQPRGFFPATIRAITVETDDSRVIELATDARMQWRSGQHVSLRVAVGEHDIYRTYSICEPSASGCIKLGVRLLRGGVFSDWLRRCNIGDEVALSRPQGRFYLRAPGAADDARNLFIAAGSGITPVIGMVDEFLAARADASALLLYANRSLASTMFLERLLQLKNRFMSRFELHFFTSRERQAVAWRSGRIDADRLQQLQDKNLLRVADFARFYLCGRPNMMESCARFLRDNGAPAARIHREVFAPAQTAAALAAPATRADDTGDAAVIARVTVTVNGMQRAFDFCADDASVLAAAARRRIALPFACTDGVCGTCRCKIVTGRATMTQNHALEAADLDAGFTLACQSRPQGDLEVSFDY